ncbi:hypothetical protein [Tepidibacter sp. Z1-5]|uniref:hypothetical protein n=1 Tax=Tepidibacter sp. Z1-5 TaxID=3134138 RepID=UPI0030BE41C1
MDIQTSVDIYKNNKLYGDYHKIINEKKYPTSSLGESFISFYEYEKVEIKFNSNNLDDILELECYYDEEVLKYGEEVLFKLKPGDCKTLSLGGDNDDMLVPGHYFIGIKTNGVRYEGTYTVIPSAVIKWKSLMGMRQYLESILKGLSYNMYLERKGYSREAILDNKTILEKYKYIEEESFNILECIDMIIKKPIINIEKEYGLKKYQKKNDCKSQRWMAKKGSKYNNIYSPSLFYEKHIDSSYNVYENIMLKSIIEYIYSIILEVKNEYHKNLEILINKENEENNKYSILKKNYDSISKNNKNMIKRRREIKRDIDIMESEIENYIKKEDTIKLYIERINKFKNELNYYMNETWLKDIKIKHCDNKPSVRMLKNKNYGSIYKIYMNLLSSTTEGNEEKSFPHKKTSKLFEIYNYLLIKDIIEDLGFKWIDGWIKAKDVMSSLNYDLESGETIIFKKDNYNLELSYDKFLNRGNNLIDKDISQIVSSTYDNRRPDILMSLYDGFRFLGSMIIEVKYRKKSNIYHKKIETDVIYQLKGYRGLEYYDGNKKRLSDVRPIKKIITVYPGQDDERKFTYDMYGFTFLQIMPCENNEKPEGYIELKEEVEEFIDSNICIVNK